MEEKSGGGRGQLCCDLAAPKRCHRLCRALLFQTVFMCRVKFLDIFTTINIMVLEMFFLVFIIITAGGSHPVGIVYFTFWTFRMILRLLFVFT